MAQPSPLVASLAGHVTANRVAPWLDDGDLQLYHGDALSILQGLPAGIAQTCVTSPPYWGLRDYGTGEWSGGNETCDHLGAPFRTKANINANCGTGADVKNGEGREPMGQTCSKCGAQRVDSQLGLEATPQEYVENMVALFREVRRVLRDDGTLWVNLGDSYAAGGTGRRDDDTLPTPRGGHTVGAIPGYYVGRSAPPGLKPKDLVGIPWRVAFALQADGWYLRSDIIWSKPNPMPESVTDRPTKAHEYLFLFSKQPRYFYDADAIREPFGDNTHGGGSLGRMNGDRNDGGAPLNGRENPAGRNRRSVWVIPTEPFPEAHFATYPQELVRPCILAGTSERGECSECGAPWARQVEREPAPDPMPYDGKHGQNGDRHAAASRIDANKRARRAQGFPHDQSFPAPRAGEWRASCSCGAPTRPQLVLDPFIGSGTTSLVARKHGRRSIGIDLSVEYLAIAAKRTQQLSLLGAAR